MSYRYPLIVDLPTLRGQMLKVIAEANEVICAIDARESIERIVEEYCDMEHAAETAERLAYAAYGGIALHHGRQYVINKNRKRGYYEVK